jgi:F0F1-type ATP synthase delta subunit
LCNKQAEDIIAKLKKIEVQLSNNKENYFSNAAYLFSAFSDQQRNEFDVELKSLFDEVNSKISELKEVVDKTKFNSATYD